MTTEELEQLLKLNDMWRQGDPLGKRANLTDVDLTGANLDYACWGLSCKTLRVKADEGICAQLMYHTVRLMQNSGVPVSLKMVELANKAPQIARHRLPLVSL